MSEEINIEQLTKALVKEIEEYTTEVSEKIADIQKGLGKKGVNRLRETSPKLSGDYAKGWRLKTEKGAVIIHNATDYQLTHLLENGHLGRDGKQVPAYPHIGKVEEDLMNQYIEAIEKAAGG